MSGLPTRDLAQRPAPGSWSCKHTHSLWHPASFNRVLYRAIYYIFGESEEAWHVHLLGFAPSSLLQSSRHLAREAFSAVSS